MKIEKASQRGKTTVRLSGDFQAEHIAELDKQFQDVVVGGFVTERTSQKERGAM